MKAPGISRRTWMVIAIGAALVIGAAISISLPSTGEFADKVVSDVVETGIGLAAGVFILWAAMRFGKGEPIRRQWTLIGVGVLMFAIGDLVWSYYEVLLKVAEPPYPSVADIFYVLQYPFLAGGLVLAALAYRGLVDVKVPFAISAGVSVALGIVVWIFVLQPIVADAEIGLLEKVLSAFYPIGDLLLELLPVLFICLVVLKLRGGRLGWPWWAVGVGVVMMAISDTSYSYLSSVDKYVSGMVIDYGWMAGQALCAVGASLALDVMGRKAA